MKTFKKLAKETIELAKQNPNKSILFSYNGINLYFYSIHSIEDIYIEYHFALKNKNHFEVDKIVSDFYKL